MVNNAIGNIIAKTAKVVIDRNHPDIKRLLRKRMVEVRDAVGNIIIGGVVYDVLMEDVSPIILLNDFGLDFPEVKSLVFVRTSKRSCKKAVGFHLSPTSFTEMLKYGKTFWLSRHVEMTKRKK
jgi:hypothetical protein